MGSLTSRPSVPQQPVSVAPLPQPAPVSTPVPQVQDDAPSVEEQATQARRSSLLQRDRGRFGTILSGFRGLLTQSNSNAGQDTQSRKTLLGE